MQRDEAIQIVAACKDEVRRQFGVRSLSLFGSVARNEANSASDVDVLVEFDRPTGYFGLIALQEYLESRFGCKVDLGTSGSLKPRLRERVLGECIHVA
jgi:predicted nucleotidyltransferase